MSVRSMSYAPGVHQEDLAILEAHLQSDPRAADLVAEVQATSAGLKSQTEKWDTQRHAVKETNSAAANVDETLHSAVRAAHVVILEDVLNNRRSPKFLTYFPRGLVGIFTAPYTDELQAVRALAERCTQDPSPKIQEQASLLGTAADQMSAALDRRTAALLAESVAFGQLQVEKTRAIEICRRTGHRLTEIYPAQQDRVRSYFRPTRRRARPTLPATDAPAAEAPGTSASGPPTTSGPLLPATSGPVVLGVSAPVPPALVLTSTAANL